MERLSPRHTRSPGEEAQTAAAHQPAHLCVWIPGVLTDSARRRRRCLVIRFTDDAAIMGCIPVNGETDSQLATLTSRCNANNLPLIVSKNAEMIVHPLRPDISPWSRHMDAIEAAAPETRILMNFYRCTIDRMLAETSGPRTEALTSTQLSNNTPVYSNTFLYFYPVCSNTFLYFYPVYSNMFLYFYLASC